MRRALSPQYQVKIDQQIDQVQIFEIQNTYVDEEVQTRNAMNVILAGTGKYISEEDGKMVENGG